MADKKVSELAELTGANSASDDEFLIVDTDGSETKRMTRAELKIALDVDDIETDLKSAQRTIPIPLTSILLEDGTVLTKYSAGAATPGFSQQGNEEAVLTWDGNGTPGDVITTILMPEDVDDSADVILHLLGTPSSTNDSPVFTVEAYFAVAGAALNADADCGGESGEFTANTTLEEKTLTIASADVPASPSALTLVFHPKDGELGTDEFYLAACWLEYTRQMLTS